jgi:general secretion pathway protein M
VGGPLNAVNEPRSAAGTPGGGVVAGAAAAARTRWSSLAARERRLVGVAAAVLGLYLVWALAVQPALRTIERAAVERESLESQWQLMLRLADEARQLRAAPPVSRDEAVETLQAATARLGAAGRLTLQGNRAVLTLNGVGTAALRDWLAEVRSGARARPIEATLSRVAQGYNGTLVVAIGGDA